VRQIRNHESAHLVGDDDLRESGRQIRGLGDYPDAGLGTAVSGHDAAQIAGGEGDLARAGAMCSKEGDEEGEQSGCRTQRRYGGRIQSSRSCGRSITRSAFQLLTSSMLAE